jgi:hypothetical protein
MYCPSCDYNNSISNVFCSLCGYYMNEPVKIDFSKKRSPKESCFTLKNKR